MADYKKIVSLFREKNKGISWSILSKETPCDLGTTDTKGVFGVKKNNSSYGIDWGSFELYADELGFYPTCENFKNIPIGIYNVIFKKIFWDSIQGDKIKNQGIANILVENRGLGLANVFEALKKLGYIRPYPTTTDLATSISISFKLTDDDINFINQLDAQGKSSLLFDELTKNNSRKSKIYWISKMYVLKTSEKIALGVGVLFVGYLVYKIIKR